MSEILYLVKSSGDTLQKHRASLGLNKGHEACTVVLLRRTTADDNIAVIKIPLELRLQVKNWPLHLVILDQAEKKVDWHVEVKSPSIGDKDSYRRTWALDLSSLVQPDALPEQTASPCLVSPYHYEMWCIYLHDEANYRGSKPPLAPVAERQAWVDAILEYETLLREVAVYMALWEAKVFEALDSLVDDWGKRHLTPSLLEQPSLRAAVAVGYLTFNIIPMTAMDSWLRCERALLFLDTLNRCPCPPDGLEHADIGAPFSTIGHRALKLTKRESFAYDASLRHVTLLADTLSNAMKRNGQMQSRRLPAAASDLEAGFEAVSARFQTHRFDPQAALLHQLDAYDACPRANKRWTTQIRSAIQKAGPAHPSQALLQAPVLDIEDLGRLAMLPACIGRVIKYGRENRHLKDRQRYAMARYLRDIGVESGLTECTTWLTTDSDKDPSSLYQRIEAERRNPRPFKPQTCASIIARTDGETEEGFYCFYRKRGAEHGAAHRLCAEQLGLPLHSFDSPVVATQLLHAKRR